MFVTSKANPEFDVDSNGIQYTYYGYCRFPYAVFTVHFLKLGFNFSM